MNFEEDYSLEYVDNLNWKKIDRYYKNINGIENRLKFMEYLENYFEKLMIDISNPNTVKEMDFYDNSNYHLFDEYKDTYSKIKLVLEYLRKQYESSNDGKYKSGAKKIAWIGDDEYLNKAFIELLHKKLITKKTFDNSKKLMKNHFYLGGLLEERNSPIDCEKIKIERNKEQTAQEIYRMSIEWEENNWLEKPLKPIEIANHFINENNEPLDNKSISKSISRLKK